MAHGEPEFGIISAQRKEAFRCASEDGDFGGREEREDAELNVLWEIGEGNGTTHFVGFGIGHFCLGLGKCFLGKVKDFSREYRDKSDFLGCKKKITC